MHIGISFDTGMGLGIDYDAIRAMGTTHAPHDWSPIVPIRADAIEHDLGLPDSTLDGLLVEDVDVEELDRVVDG